MHKQSLGWLFFGLIASNSILFTIAYPNVHTQGSNTYLQNQGSNGFVPSAIPQLPSVRMDRKFAEKPNAIKKVALDDLDDLQTNEISGSTGGGFSWSNILGMVMQMIFNPATAQGPNKSDSLDDNGVAQSPWANLISVGLKILTAFLGGGASPGGEGIDKVDNGGSPMQGVLAAVFSAVLGGRDPNQVNAMAKQAGEFINILINLLDALKTSFSHRSLQARSIGKKDYTSDASVAGLTMMKSYVKSLNAIDNSCLQKYICEANKECSHDIGQSSLFCHLGNYAASYILDRTSSASFDVLYEAGRRGRAGDNCQQSYLDCNEV